MKTIIVSIFGLLLAWQSHAQFSKATLKANGLTCAMCSNAVNKALERLSFVEKVEADIKNTAFNIRFKPDADVQPDAIREAVEGAGFSVGSLRLTAQFHQLKISKDQHVKIGNATYHFLNTPEQHLNGEQTITLLDRNFVSDPVFKKVKTYSQMPCVITGRAAACCSDGEAGQRIYHSTI
ncbi:hypothetical protein GCM10027051_18930 [Niabella terrae]